MENENITAAEGKPYLSNHPKLEPYKWAAGMVLLLWHLASGITYVVMLLSTGRVL